MGMQVDAVENVVSPEPTKFAEDAVLQSPGGNTTMANGSIVVEEPGAVASRRDEPAIPETVTAVPVAAPVDPGDDTTAIEIKADISRTAVDGTVTRGLKRKFEDMIAMDEDPALSDDADAETPSMSLKVNQDGTVEQVDTVR
jgi:hypothetical protein